MINDVQDLEKQLQEGGGWIHATREEAESYRKRIIELNGRAEKYASKLEDERAKFFNELEDNFPKEETISDEIEKQFKPIKKIGDAIAKFFGQDSMADVGDTIDSFWGNEMVIPKQPIKEKYGEKVKEYQEVASNMIGILKEKEAELNEELTGIENELLLASLEHKIGSKEKELGVDFKYMQEGQELFVFSSQHSQ